MYKFVQSCQVCIHAKPDRASYPGKLQPLPVLLEAWETISMDFIEGLPHSDRASCILVIIDKFTKYSHFSFVTPLHYSISFYCFPECGVQVTWVTSIHNIKS
jgi:hypothetical protein